MPDNTKATDIPATADLTKMRITDGAGRSTSLDIPATELDVQSGPVVRMRMFTDTQNVVHIEYDIAHDLPPQEQPPTPNDPLNQYYFGRITLKRALKEDEVFEPPQELGDNIPLDLTKGVNIRTYLTDPEKKPIGPLLNFVIDQSP